MKTKILIVDDELVNLNLLEDLITDFDNNIEIIAVDSASLGLYHYFTNSFDLVLLDIFMAHINGNDFITIVEENLKAGLVTHGPNIIVQTSMKEDFKISLLAKKECVLEVIRKPITPKHIQDCLSRYCI